jgi:hypothetical protein
MKNQQADKYNLNLLKFTITNITRYGLTQPEFVLVTFFSSTSGKVDKDNKGVIEDAQVGIEVIYVAKCAYTRLFIA